MFVATEKDFARMSARILDTCCRLFAETGEVVPVVLATNFNDQRDFVDSTTVIVADLMRDTHSKDLVAHLFNQLSAKHDMAAFVSEMWFVEKVREPIDVPPSEHPDRREGVLVVLRSRDYEMVVYHAIDREKKTLIAGDLKHADKLTGRFCRGPVTHH